MARATNGLGQFRGKVGSVVFRVSEGQQIASAYQPQVRNPKSNLQTAQRNKMYLATQISKLVSQNEIIGLGTTPRNRRSMFIKNIIDNAVSRLNNGVFTTSIDEKKVLFSNGVDSRIKSLFTVTTGDGSAASYSLNFETTGGIDVTNIAIKTVEIRIQNNEFTYLKSSYLQLPNVGATQSYNINIPSGTKVILYAIPIRLKENYRVVDEELTQLQFNSTTGENEYVVVGKYGESAASYQYYKSFVIGSWGNSGVIVTPDGDGDEVVNPDGPNINPTSVDDGE